MNIAIITSESPYPDNSGGRKYTWERIKALKKYGNRLFLYSFNDEYLKENDINTMNDICESIKLYSRNKKIMLNLLNFYKPFTAYSRFNKNLRKDIINDIKKESIDLIIVDAPQLLYNVSSINNIPLVLSQHNIEYKTFLDISRKSKNIMKKLSYLFEGIKLKKFEENFYKKEMINLYTFISTEEKEFFEKEFNKKNTLLVRMGVNVEKSDREKDRINRISFIGKMNYYPNVEAIKWFCNDIFPIISDRLNKNVDLYIVGKDPVKDIRDFKDENIYVTGTVDDVKQYIDNSDIIIIPLLSGGGVKIKLLEALSRNKIVVTTSKGIEGTEFKNNIHLLVADNVKDFAEKCIDVLCNADKYEYLIKNSFDILEKEYSWNSIGANYNDALEKLVSKNRRI